MNKTSRPNNGSYQPESTEQLKRRIAAEYENLPKHQKTVADFLVTSMQEAAFLSVVEIGERCSVSKATVVRFAQRLVVLCKQGEEPSAEISKGALGRCNRRVRQTRRISGTIAERWSRV